MTLFRFVAVILLGAGWLNSASAHPHAWIDMQTRFLVNDQQELTGFDLIWHFDDFYSASILEDMKQKNEPLDKQYQDFARDSIEYMTQENWLTRFQMNGKTLKFKKPTSYKTEKYAHHLALHFILPLKVPAPISGNTFQLSIYDSTYYVEMLHHKLSAISITDDAATECSIKLKAPEPPEDLSAYAASLDLNAQSDEGLGEMFAEKITLTCN